MSLAWGVPYLFIKIAVDDGLSPGFVAWSRVALATLMLLPVALKAGALRGLPLAWLVAFAITEICIPFPLIGFGETRVSSSLAAILIASVPLMVAVLAFWVDRSERVTGVRLVGLFIGFGGVIALVGLDVAGNADELVGAVAILLAAFGYALAPMLLKLRLADVDPRATMAGALAIASLALTPAAIVAPPSVGLSPEAVGSVAALGIFCTAAALVLFGALVAEVGAGRALVITYVAPVIAVALGVAVLGERPGTGAIAGLLLIIAGSWLSTGGRLPPGLAAAGNSLLRLRMPAWSRSTTTSSSPPSS
jgi:drug/metabolite transporter (DMT)-like permease